MDPDLGLPSLARLKAELARDVYLQLAGMEEIASVGSLDLQRLANDVERTRNDAVVARLDSTADFVDLASTTDALTVEVVEERIPHAAVLFTFYTGVALRGAWDLIDQVASRAKA